MKSTANEIPKEEKLYLVEDFTGIQDAIDEGSITPEQAWAGFGASREKGLFNGPDAKEYLEDFGEPAMLVGASDSGTINGDNMYETPLMLQLEKRGEVKRNVLASTQKNFDDGHLAENYIGETVSFMMRRDGVLSDFRFVPSREGFIHGKNPETLIHPDGYFMANKDDKKKGIEKDDLIALVEIKSAHKNSVYWTRYFQNGEIPPAYQDQCQVEMEDLDIDTCWVLAWNKSGTSDEDFRYIELKRDRKKAKALLKKHKQFVADTLAGKLWDDECLPEEAAVIYAEEDKKLGYKELPKKHQKTLEEIVKLAEERAALVEEKKDIEKDIREIDKDLKLLKSRLYTSIGKAPGGTFKVGNRNCRIKVRRSYSLDEDVKKYAMQTYPEEWADIISQKPLISSTLEWTEGADEDVTTIDIE